MRKFIRFFFFSLLILVFLNGCKTNEAIETKDIFQFKNSYVGDSGAVGNITRTLPNPNGEQLNGLELKTTEKPYGIILNYIKAENSEDVEVNYTESALYNATYILALVHNADWVKFNFVEQEFIVNREELQSFYGKNIREFNNQEELSMFIQEYLEDEIRVNQFFN